VGWTGVLNRRFGSPCAVCRTRTTFTFDRALGIRQKPGVTIGALPQGRANVHVRGASPTIVFAEGRRYGRPPSARTESPFTPAYPAPSRCGQDRRYAGVSMDALGPLIPDDSSRASRAWRRVRGIALEVVALVLITALSPVLLIGAVAVDGALSLRRRKRWMAVRLLAMMWWFLVGELYALLNLLGIWVLSFGRDGPRPRERVYRLKRRWLAEPPRRYPGIVRPAFRS
jgi:hypothetical protein